MHATLEAVTRSAVSVRYPVRPRLEDWVLPEGNVPESVPHDRATEHLKDVLSAFAARSERNIFIARNLAIRWMEEAPQIGIDPDICMLDPPPPNAEDLLSVCLWKEGHYPPPLNIEIVSTNHPYKDYTAVQDRYAAMGARELVVFDPLLAGPPSLGGPVALQLWRRDDIGVLERVHFGGDPVFSEVLDAWFVPKGRLLCIADDRNGEQLWLTRTESERQDKDRALMERERERAEKEHEKAVREELERRLSELTKTQ